MPDITQPDLLWGRAPLPQMLNGRPLPYGDTRQARAFLDALAVPYVICRRQRYYRLETVREALDRYEQGLIATAAA
jgi:hypothetical protein